MQSLYPFTAHYLAVCALLCSWLLAFVVPCAGYGGGGTAFGDLWVLHLGGDSGGLHWEEVSASGAAPAARFDHTAVALATAANSPSPDKLVVLGGRDSNQSFTDAHVLDLDSMAWLSGHGVPPLTGEVSTLAQGSALPSCSLDAGWQVCHGTGAQPCWSRPRLPTSPACQHLQNVLEMPASHLPFPSLMLPVLLQVCNHLCASVDSVPYHKMFAGFGKSATLQYLSSVQVGLRVGA